jgi:hypothetical protein
MLSTNILQRMVPQTFRRCAKRKLGTSSVKGDEKEGWSLTTKLAIAVATVVVPTSITVSTLRSDPELRNDIQVKFPEVYDVLATIIPGGVEGVTMAEVLAKRNDWPLEHELPWGEGYDENIPPRNAIVTTKRGTKFTVDLIATDCGQSIIEKVIPLGASFDDSVLDVQFVKSVESGSAFSSAMLLDRESRAPVEGLNYSELKEKLNQVREIEQRMKVDFEVWRQMGPNGMGKVSELTQELLNIENEKINIKNLMKR